MTAPPPPIGARRTGHHGRPTPDDDKRAYLAQLGLRAHARRRQLDYSKEFLGTYLGWSGTKIANVEQGRVALSILDLIDLAEALLIDPAALAFGAKKHSRRPKQ
jgi:hypothetical protein